MSTCSCHDKSTAFACCIPYIHPCHTPQGGIFRVEVDFPAAGDSLSNLSLPCVGEAPISVSDCGRLDRPAYRNVGKVTGRFLPSRRRQNCGFVAVMVTAVLSMPSATKSLVVIAGGTICTDPRLMRYFVRKPTGNQPATRFCWLQTGTVLLYRQEMAEQQHHNLIHDTDEG